MSSTPKRLLPNERNKIFDESSPIALRNSSINSDDDEDDLYDESGDESGEGWGTDTDDFSEECEEKPVANIIEEKKIEEKKEKKSKKTKKVKKKDKKKDKKSSIATDINDELLIENDKNNTTKEIHEETNDKETAYKQSDLFQEFEAFKSRVQSSPKLNVNTENESPDIIETKVVEEKEVEDTGVNDINQIDEIKQPQVITENYNKSEINLDSGDETSDDIEIVKDNKNEKIKEEINNSEIKHDDKEINEDDKEINDGHPIRLRVRDRNRSVSKSQEFFQIAMNNQDVTKSSKRKSLMYKLRISKDISKISEESAKDDIDMLSPTYRPISNARRDIESELAIDGAPVTPGADYFYSPADLDLLKEMEEREAMKAAYALSSTETKENKKNERKKKLKVALNKLKNDDKDTNSEIIIAERNAQMVALQKQRDKNHSDNLLSESTDLDVGIRRRNLIINEIVSTERDFKDDLDVIVNIFYKPLLTNEIISTQQCSSIFSNIDVIYDICKSTVSKLDKTVLLPGGPKISNCFSELIKYHKMYSAYCNNHSNSCELTETLVKKNSTFRQFIEEAQNNPRCGGLQFVSFIIKPVQRICKYPLLLKELIKHEQDEEEKEDLEYVLQTISDIVTDINESKRAAENMNKIIQIQKKLIAKNVELLQPGRSFILEGILQEYTKNDFQMAYYCLFNDILIRAEKKKKNKFGTMRRNEKLNLTDHVTLYSLKVTTKPDTMEYCNAFEIQLGNKKYLVCASSPKEKSEWLNAFKEQLMHLHQEQESLAPQKTHSRKSSNVSESVEVNSNTSSPKITNASLSKIKCYLNKGTPQQRIRKISIAGLDSVATLKKRVCKEFEWEDDYKFLLSYEDEDKDVIEISASTSVSDIVEEAKFFLISPIS